MEGGGGGGAGRRRRRESERQNQEDRRAREEAGTEGDARRADRSRAGGRGRREEGGRSRSRRGEKKERVLLSFFFSSSFARPRPRSRPTKNFPLFCSPLPLALQAGLRIVTAIGGGPKLGASSKGIGEIGESGEDGQLPTTTGQSRGEKKKGRAAEHGAMQTEFDISVKSLSRPPPHFTYSWPRASWRRASSGRPSSRRPSSRRASWPGGGEGGGWW